MVLKKSLMAIITETFWLNSSPLELAETENYEYDKFNTFGLHKVVNIESR